MISRDAISCFGDKMNVTYVVNTSLEVSRVVVAASLHSDVQWVLGIQHGSYETRNVRLVT